MPPETIESPKRFNPSPLVSILVVLLILIGGGKLLVSFPRATSTIPAVLIGMGFILVPVWWRLGFKTR